jgi:hypothetical protein
MEDQQMVKAFLPLPEQCKAQICCRYHESDTSVLAHTAWLLGAVRATQGSVRDRVTPTWITLRDLSSKMKNACERSKEEICDL